MESVQKLETGLPAVDGYIPTLNGWRAVAVAAVIIYHDRVHQWGPVSNRLLHEWSSLGVDLFFGLSGLLICSRLLAEETRNDAIALGGFYLRRAFRILPAMLVCLVALLLLGVAHVIPLGIRSWLSALVFMNNYQSALHRDTMYSPYTNHFWSLAVEEHFYLILPVLLVLWRGWRVRVILLTGLTLAGCAWTNLYFALHRADPLRSYAAMRSDLRLYELFFPSLLAVLLTAAPVQAALKRVCRPLPVIALILLATVIAVHLHREGAVHMMVAPFLFPFVILSTVFYPRSWLGRLLETRPSRIAGRLSYSIYLWQQLFFQASPQAGVLGLLQVWPWNLLAVSCAACASFYLVEQPAIRLGKHLLQSSRAPAASTVGVAESGWPSSAGRTLGVPGQPSRKIMQMKPMQARSAMKLPRLRLFRRFKRLGEAG